MKKICDLMEKVLYIVGMASVAVFFVCTTVQVCSRVFGFQAAFTEEVANAALAWCCFIGSAPMVRSNEHFKFTALTEKLKGKSLFADELAGHIFVLIFNLVVGIYGIKLVQQFAAWKMTSMPVSKGWSWLCVPIFGLTAAVFSVLLQIILNLPFLLLGFGTKLLFFTVKGMGKEYLAGIKNGFSISRQGKKVKFSMKNLPHYAKIQVELWINMFRRLAA